MFLLFYFIGITLDSGPDLYNLKHAHTQWGSFVLRNP